MTSIGQGKSFELSLFSSGLPFSRAVETFTKVVKLKKGDSVSFYYYYVKFLLTFDNTLIYPLGYETARDRAIPVEGGGLLG
jgi:hypothetical protein